MKMRTFILALTALAFVNPVQADLINELEPMNTSVQSIEIKGTAGSNFFVDLFVVGTTGTIDRRVVDISGTYDANGLALLTISSLPNPSFTIFLAQGLNKTLGFDLDQNDDGFIDAGTHWGNLLDTVGISGANTGNLYGASSGGIDLVYNGESPDLAFRDGTSNDWFVTIPSDSDSVFDADGNDVLLNGVFDQDPFVSTFGSINPSLSAVPEPATAGILLGCGLLSLCIRRRR